MVKNMRKSSEERKEETVFKKADELSVLCGIEVCLISYGVNGEIKTFPEDKEKVCDMARRFTQLSETSRSKKSSSLEDVLEDIHLQKMKMKKRKEEKKVVNTNLGSQYDSYSIDELKLGVESIRRKFRSIHEYRENNKEKKKKIDYGNMASSSSPLELGFQISKKINYGNISSSSSSSPPDLGFQISKEKKKMDYGNNASSSSSSPAELELGVDLIVEESNIEFGEPSFGFDLKEVESLLGNYDVEEEIWNQGVFHQHHHNNNLR